jgi:hypothetical protein
MPYLWLGVVPPAPGGSDLEDVAGFAPWAAMCIRGSDFIRPVAEVRAGLGHAG